MEEKGQKHSGQGQSDKYRLILQNVRSFAIFSADLEGRIDEWNPGAEHLFGYRTEEILGQPMELLYVPEDRVAGRAELEKAKAAQTGFSEDERWHLRKDGSRFFVSGMVHAMYDDAGNLCGFIKVARDITPRKLLEDRLAASEAHHRLILNAVKDFAIITLDLHGNITAWNPGATVTFGHEPEEVLGRNFSLLFPPEDQAKHVPEDYLARVRKDGFIQTEGWAVRKDGTRIFVIDVLRLMSDDPAGKSAILQVARDITVRHLTRLNLQTTQRELEHARDELELKVGHRTMELQQSVQSLEQVLYHVAHDLRAPLRAMEGFTSILVENCAPSLDEEAERLGSLISNAAKRMDLLIQDLLTYGRICGEPMRREKVSTELAVQAALTGLEEELRQAGAEVRLLSPLADVQGDPGVFRRVMCELIANAVAFAAPDRKPLVRIRSEPCGSSARLWVEDNGVGIPYQHLDRIFWMFERLSHNGGSGTGMGLAIARKGIERMGGRLGVESELGVGSRFWVELPAAGGPA